jgi:hypothetical protein
MRTETGPSLATCPILNDFANTLAVPAAAKVPIIADLFNKTAFCIILMPSAILPPSAVCTPVARSALSIKDNAAPPSIADIEKLRLTLLRGDFLRTIHG